MVPCDRILDAAIAEGADLIGSRGSSRPHSTRWCTSRARWSGAHRQATVDRRRDHQSATHRVKIAPAFAGRRCTCSTRRARSAWCRRCSRTSAATPSLPPTSPNRSGCAKTYAGAPRAPALLRRSPRAAPRSTSSGVARETRVLRPSRAGRDRPRRARRVHRLDLLLPRLELKGKFRRSSTTRTRRRARELYETARAAPAHRRREAAASTWQLRFLAANAEGDDLVLWTDASCHTRRRASRCCASSALQKASPACHWWTSSRPSRAASWTRRRVRGDRRLGADALAARFEAELDD